jgi:hypothetical protein
LSQVHGIAPTLNRLDGNLPQAQYHPIFQRLTHRLPYIDKHFFIIDPSVGRQPFHWESKIPCGAVLSMPQPVSTTAAQPEGKILARRGPFVQNGRKNGILCIIRWTKKKTTC